VSLDELIDSENDAEKELKPYNLENRSGSMSRRLELRCHMKIISFYTQVCTKTLGRHQATKLGSLNDWSAQLPVLCHLPTLLHRKRFELLIECLKGESATAKRLI